MTMDADCTVHIIQGITAAETLRQALGVPAVLVHEDVLSYGRLPQFESIEQWRRDREQALASALSFGERVEKPFDRAETLLGQVGALRHAQRIVLWIGTGLSDHLLLAWMVHLLRLLDVPLERADVIQFTHHPRYGREVYGVGLLNPEDIARHPPAVRLGEDALVSLEAAWDAVTASSPQPLLTFLAKESRQPLPFLRASLASLLQRFPDRTTGLSRWEAELLKYAEEAGPSALRTIAYTMAENMDTPDMVGEGYLFARLHHLADQALAYPLVALTGAVREMRGTDVRVTDTGRAVLAGVANRVTVNGIDEWVGGIRLDSAAGKVWFHEAGTLVPGC